MKKSFFKISSFVMAIVVLLSTFSFAVDQHYCGDVLVDFSFFGKAESCGMEMQQSSESYDDSLDKKGCCEDQTLAIAGQDDLKISFEKLSSEQQLFVVSFIYSYINFYEGFDTKIVPFRDYSPPPLIRDVQVLNQTFLI
ncbi:hypothetical protein PP182_09465 [Maribacter sp. PR1]|uniref:Secreted protein n=1 Tax=Maribacter cobaltidurans TaxID=1178778 RepID=A0ABU7ITI9_9FLAO|nr:MULTISPECIES: hypothetical protein [Maribacter]MDC6388907.1 hypothetical protein [Maribacter sp. PR1]MEE1976295.1 hypothetical protein [Maribacter cobaltidurans]|tara:strand:- start:6198 stop:6614 length:417 start_codon:yes stop_codon:yes gene_type:complete